MRIDQKAVAARAKGLPQHVEHLSVLITELARFAHPADMVVSRYFRSQPKLGNRDRALIAEASFAFLRRKTEISQFAESGQGPLGRRLALLSLFIIMVESGSGDVTSGRSSARAPSRRGRRRPRPPSPCGGPWRSSPPCHRWCTRRCSRPSRARAAAPPRRRRARS